MRGKKENWQHGNHKLKACGRGGEEKFEFGINPGLSDDMSLEQGTAIMGGTVSVFLGVITLGTSTGATTLAAYALTGGDIVLGLDEMTTDKDGNTLITRKIFTADETKAMFKAAKAGLAFNSLKDAAKNLAQKGEKLKEVPIILNSIKEYFDNLIETSDQLDKSVQKKDD